MKIINKCIYANPLDVLSNVAEVICYMENQIDLPHNFRYFQHSDDDLYIAIESGVRDYDTREDAEKAMCSEEGPYEINSPEVYTEIWLNMETGIAEVTCCDSWGYKKSSEWNEWRRKYWENYYKERGVTFFD